MRQAEFSQQLLSWFDRHRRDLPWRLPPDAPIHARLDPYHVLVSEAMLQQTQVATVIDYFRRFIARFPTIVSLAQADSQEVLRLWQGLGYYSRARHLQSAARTIMMDHGGRVPGSVDELLKLPGVGRYTAGAVASIAFEQPEPIVDGNVARVLCRLEAMPDDPRGKSMQAWLWERAEHILPARRIGDFNSALMELGALVCTPKSPQCRLCPVQNHCRAFAGGVVDKIPPPRKRAPRPLYRRQVFAIYRNGKYLIEQRPPTGRWAGLWQFITRPMEERLNHSLGIQIGKSQAIGEVRHDLTHRRYHFQVFHCLAEWPGTEFPAGGVWAGLEEISRYPMSRPHLKIAQMLKDSLEGVAPATPGFPKDATAGDRRLEGVAPATPRFPQGVAAGDRRLEGVAPATPRFPQGAAARDRRPPREDQTDRRRRRGNSSSARLTPNS